MGASSFSLSSYFLEKGPSPLTAPYAVPGRCRAVPNELRHSFLRYCRLSILRRSPHSNPAFQPGNNLFAPMGRLGRLALPPRPGLGQTTSRGIGTRAYWSRRLPVCQSKTSLARTQYAAHTEYASLGPLYNSFLAAPHQKASRQHTLPKHLANRVTASFLGLLSLFTEILNLHARTIRQPSNSG